MSSTYRPFTGWNDVNTVNTPLPSGSASDTSTHSSYFGSRFSTPTTRYLDTVEFQLPNSLSQLLVNSFFSDQKEQVYDENNKISIEQKTWESNEPSRCTICMSDLEQGDKYYHLDCNHDFHVECLDGWGYRGHTTCPVCRADSIRF